MKEREDMKRSMKKQSNQIMELDKKVTILQNELDRERMNSESLINELELNEKGLGELNQKLKTYLNQVNEMNEKTAKMTNEKTKDMQTIKLLNDLKNSMETRLSQLESEVEIRTELIKKYETDNIILKDLKQKQEMQVRLKEDESDILKKDVLKYAKQSDENKIAHESTLKALNVTENNSKKHLTHYEQLKIKYESLCKIKNIDNKVGVMSYEELVKETNVLQMEVNNFRVYIFIMLEYGQM